MILLHEIKRKSYVHPDLANFCHFILKYVILYSKEIIASKQLKIPVVEYGKPCNAGRLREAEGVAHTGCGINHYKSTVIENIKIENIKYCPGHKGLA